MAGLPAVDRLPDALREKLIEIATLSPIDVASWGQITVGPAVAQYLLDADDLHQTMLALTQARQINPQIMRLLRTPGAVETLQILSNQEVKP